MPKPPKTRRPDIPQKYRSLVAEPKIRARTHVGNRRPDKTPLPELQAHHTRGDHGCAGAIRPPTLRLRDMEKLVMRATGGSREEARRILSAIVRAMIDAVTSNFADGHEHVILRDLGTFWKWRHRYGHRFAKGRKGLCIDVRFRPHPSWYAPWMPVTAYDVAGQPIGIYNGWQQILPWGHPDNPYASPDEVPLQPERYWEASTPLPGQTKKPQRSPEWDVLKDPLLTDHQRTANTRRRL